MKTRSIIIALFCLALTGCSDDYINLLPEDSIAPDEYFQTDEQLAQAVTAAYVPLRDLLVNDYFTSEMRSDNTHYQPAPSNRGTAIVYRENVADWNNDANNNYVNAVYYHCYTGISRANIVLGRLPDAQNATEEGKALAEGQAKFLRAFNYFKLVRLFGGVPLYLQEVTKAEEAFLPRASADEVYQQIIADATDAVALLPAPDGFPQNGQATKGSATILLADVYLTLRRYAEAEGLLRTLPEMGYGLLDNYQDVFEPANKNSKESLFEVQYLEGTAVGTQPNPLPFHFMPRTANTVLITGDPSSNTTGSGGWNKPTQDLIDSYEEGDTRLEASIAIAEGTYDAVYYMVISAVKSAGDYQPAPGTVGQPYIKKYLHPPFVAANNSNENWPVYRYAEALLMLAEVLNEQGKPALEPLNEVRMRAGLDAVTTTDQAELRAIILHERRVELAFENKRFHDLQRSPDGLAIMQAYAAKAKESYDLLPATAFDIQEYKFLFPIPQPERGLNPDLEQNPGYSF